MLVNTNPSTSLRLPKKLVEEVCKFYSISEQSTAVRRGITDYFLLPPSKSEPPIDHTSLYEKLTIDERRTTTKISIRLPESLRATLKALSPSDTLSDIIAMILATVLCHPLSSVNDTAYDKKLLRILGSKWNKKMQDAIRNIFETANHRWTVSIEPCVGALGIHANFEVADTEIINDDDWNKVNLYRIIQSSPQKLALTLLSLDVSEEQFNALKKEKPALTSKADIKAAARYLYLNICSYRHMGDTFSNKMSSTSYYRRLSAIYPLHLRLSGVTIGEKDIFKVIQKYRKESNSLFIVDPNYLEANVYQDRVIRRPESYKKKFGFDEHKRLAKLLRQIKQNDGNDFIYFCRITAPRTKGKQCHAISTPEDLLIADRNLHETINDFYYGYGFYYVDVPLSDDITERIITSFPFDRATAYGKEVL